MEAKNSKTITNEMIFEELKNIRSQMEKMQADIESLKNPVGEFTSKWVDTYDVMRMLRVSRRTMDNYIKDGKLTPTRIKKRNYFEVEKVKELMHVPEILKFTNMHEYAQNLHYRFQNGELGEG
jgi:predicted transcriptional regulator